jgi:ribose transport system ATP-binding protein
LLEAVSLVNVTKAFGAVKALDNVNLKLYGGEIHGLVGENGAGKSTLMKILSGIYSQGDYSGDIFLQGEKVSFANPKEAENAGIAIIHQELSTFPHLSVAENLFVGAWLGKKSLIDWRKMFAQAQAWLNRVGAQFPMQMKMGDLSTGNQQLVEIAKAVARNKKIIIFDEPTSSLTPKESEKLFSVMQELKEQGKALVYISHRMEEIFRLCQKVTVLRDGKSISTKSIAEVNEGSLINEMVGRNLDQFFPKRTKTSAAEKIFELIDFTALHRHTGKKIGPFNFSLNKGEILGFSGLLGSGRSELFRAVLGEPIYETEGACLFKEKSMAWRGPQSAYAAQVAWLSEDRKHESLLPSRSLVENFAILRLSLRGLYKFFSAAKEDLLSERELNLLGTRYNNVRQKITDLSGGNQQKVVLARILQSNPEVIILDEPTRGVDVGAKYEIYQILMGLVESGKAIILISSDLPELMNLSDRVIVFSNGKQMGILDGERLNEQTIMKLAIGREVNE